MYDDIFPFLYTNTYIFVASPGTYKDTFPVINQLIYRQSSREGFITFKRSLSLPLSSVYNILIFGRQLGLRNLQGAR